MRGLFLISLFLPLSSVKAQLDTSIIFSEVMFIPGSANSEYIELYNPSETESVDLNNYKIIYQTENPDGIIDAGSGTILPPNSFAVILEGDYDFSTGIYKDIIPEKALLLKIDNNSFGRSGMANSSDRTIKLVNSSDDTLQIYTYSANNEPGFSDEKILLNNNNKLDNWENSTIINGTPGFYNSVSPAKYDLFISSFFITPAIPIANNTISLNLKLKNRGEEVADNFSITIFNDLNKDSTGSVSEIIYSQDYTDLGPNDSLLISNQISFAQPTKINLIAEVDFENDENPFNNREYLEFTVYPPGNEFNDVIINEIMYGPSSDQPEWIELYNKTDSLINLKKWTLSDANSAIQITDENKSINPGDFIVICEDSSIYNYYSIISEVIIVNLPSLNNSGDKIIIRDSLQVLIDSVSYDPGWGGTNGRSLERISNGISSNLSSNWRSSKDINLSTPGRINSVTPKDYDLSVSELSSIPEFPVPGDDVRLSAKIINNGSNHASFSVDFLFGEDLGRLSSEKDLELLPGDSVIIISQKQIENITSGILTAVKVNFKGDQDTLNNYIKKILIPGIIKNSLLINEIMFSPSENEPEWIEFVNCSPDTINLLNWFITNISPSHTDYIITGTDFCVAPEEFLVISSDTSFYSVYQGFSGKILLLNFGSLANSDDGIIIKDFRGGIIDSFFYKSGWGGIKGYSLERISLQKPTCDSANWAPSLSESKSTPGYENSLINIPGYSGNDLIINEIMFDPDIDNCEFIELYNPGDMEVNIGGWKAGNENKFYKLSNISFTVQPYDYFILSSDSQLVKKYNLYDYKNLNILFTGDFGLSKSGEELILKDLRGNTIDSVFYSEKWHNKNFTSTKNISLERINPLFNSNDYLNWNSSASFMGATPGKQNSIFTENTNQTNNISIEPNPFSPDNDGFEDYAVINYNLTHNTAQIRIKVFDNKGRLVRTLLNNQPGGPKGSVIFDGMEDNGQPLRIGIYIIFLEALNDITGVLETLKTVVVVAKKFR